jgi:hypothetical protein
MSQMMPPDIMAALGGGGGAPPGAGGGGLPPDIMAALGGPPEAAEGEGAPLPTDGTHGGGGDPLEAAIALLQDAIDAEADQEDVQVMLQCQTKLQGILAKNQKDTDAMLGGTASPSGIRKATGAPAAGAEGGY